MDSTNSAEENKTTILQGNKYFKSKTGVCGMHKVWRIQNPSESHIIDVGEEASKLSVKVTSS